MPQNGRPYAGQIPAIRYDLDAGTFFEQICNCIDDMLPRVGSEEQQFLRRWRHDIDLIADEAEQTRQLPFTHILHSYQIVDNLFSFPISNEYRVELVHWLLRLQNVWPVFHFRHVSLPFDAIRELLDGQTR